MKSKTYHNVGAVPNYNRKSVETGKIDTTNTHMLPVTYLESSSTAWITAVANVHVYTAESRIINVWYGVPLSLIPNLSLKYPYLV